MNLETFIINEVPSKVIYIPEFITEEEEQNIISNVNSAPKPKWTQLLNRRLQNWGGIPHKNGMIAEKIPEWLQKYINKIGNLEVFDNNKLPNHVLINEYLPGQGIMAHLDGPLFYPTVTTISCGSHTLLNFHSLKKEDNEILPNKELFSLLLERRSLLILKEDMYHNFMHSISELNEDIINKDTIKNLHLCRLNLNDNEIIKRQTRISLTIRHVPKTTMVPLRLGR